MDRRMPGNVDLFPRCRAHSHTGRVLQSLPQKGAERLDTMSKVMTPAIKLLTTVWNHGMKDSWSRINYSMACALRLAIGSGLRFKPSDFDLMAKDFRWSFWVGESSEWIYTEAVINQNESAIKAYEEWKSRTRFMANNVESDGLNSGYIHRSRVTRQRELLAVGLSFPFEERRAWVTAFDDARGIVRAAIYKSDYRSGKPAKLLRFTHEEIAALFPAPKKPKKEPEP